MPAPEAVKATAIARGELRSSITRMEFHLARGAKGARGVAREVAFIDSLHKQATRLGGASVGVAVKSTATRSFGRETLTALQGSNTKTIGRVKSSVLADFSADGLEGPRSRATIDGEPWVWTANSSACPSCLSEHGSKHTGPMVPLHPSCLCVPEEPGTSTPLDKEAIIKMSKKYGDTKRYGKLLEQLANGERTLRSLKRVNAVNTTSKGKTEVVQHRGQGIGQQTALGGGEVVEIAAPVPKTLPGTKVKEVSIGEGRNFRHMREFGVFDDYDDFFRKYAAETFPENKAGLLRAWERQASDWNVYLARRHADEAAAIAKKALDAEIAAQKAAANRLAAETSTAQERLGGYTQTGKAAIQGKPTKAHMATLSEAEKLIAQAVPAEHHHIFQRAMDRVGTFKITASKGKRRGHKLNGLWEERSFKRGQGVIDKRLTIEMNRSDFTAHSKWVDEHNKVFANIRNPQTRISDVKLSPDGKRVISGPEYAENPAFVRGRMEQNQFMDDWIKANPEPAAKYAAEPEVIAETILHELVHVLDYEDGYNAATRSTPLRDKLIADGMKKYADDAYAAGDENMWYAASRNKPGETIAEFTRFYFLGERSDTALRLGAKKLTGPEWRAKYPEAAKWVEDNILSKL